MFVEPLRLELWIEPLGCLNSKMISVGVFEEPSEVKKWRERLVNPITPLPLEISARPSLKSKERIEGLPLNRLF